VANIRDAVSEEFSKTGSLVIHYMEGQSEEGAKGGTMRLGAYDCHLEPNSYVKKIYNENDLSERHRHRLEVNNEFVSQLCEAGLVVSGRNLDLNLVEVIELNHHPHFVGCQYHPEFKSKPFSAHPLFYHFLKKADEYSQKRGNQGVVKE
jgi:CTP synthase